MPGNAGVGAACRSTLVRKLNRRRRTPGVRRAAALDQQNGRELAYLVKRRADEYRLCSVREK